MILLLLIQFKCTNELFASRTGTIVSLLLMLLFSISFSLNYIIYIYDFMQCLTYYTCKPLLLKIYWLKYSILIFINDSASLKQINGRQIERPNVQGQQK